MVIRPRHANVCRGRITMRPYEYIPYPIQESFYTLDPIRIPRHGLVKRPHEHFVHAEHVRAVRFHDVIRIHHVPFGLRHLLSPFGEDESMRTALRIRLRSALLRHDPEIPQKLVPESGIQQVKRRVFHAAVIEIDRHPVFQLLRIGERRVIVRIAIAQKVPARTRPVGHGVGFALGFAAARRTIDFHPLAHVRKRRLALVIRFMRFHVGKHQRQLIIRNRNVTAFLAVDNRNRLAPISLTREYPVAKFVCRRTFADSLLLQPRNHVLLGLPRGQPVQKAGSDVMPFAGKRLRQDGAGRFGIMRADNHADRQTKPRRELKVSLIMRGHGHDGARAVRREHVIRDPDGNRLPVCGIHSRYAFKSRAGFLFPFGHALDLRLRGGRELICANLVRILHVAFRDPRFDKRMLRRKHEICRAEQRVGTRREHRDFVR